MEIQALTSKITQLKDIRKELLFLLHPCLPLCQINPFIVRTGNRLREDGIHLEICNCLWFFSHEATEPQ